MTSMALKLGSFVIHQIATAVNLTFMLH